VVFYHIDKALILNGPYPWAHSYFMETKEHLFFIPLILALYLPLVARLRVDVNRAARAMVLVVTGLIVVDGLAIEGAVRSSIGGAKSALAEMAAAHPVPAQIHGEQ